MRKTVQEPPRVVPSIVTLVIVTTLSLANRAVMNRSSLSRAGRSFAWVACLIVASATAWAQAPIDLLGVAGDRPDSGSAQAVPQGSGQGPADGITTCPEVRNVSDKRGLSLVVRAWVAPTPEWRTVESTIEVALDSAFEVTNVTFCLHATYRGSLQGRRLGLLSDRKVYQPARGDLEWPHIRATVTLQRKKGWRSRVETALGTGTRVITLDANLPPLVFATTSTVRGKIVHSWGTRVYTVPYQNVTLASSLGTFAPVYTESDGMYNFYHVPPGQYTLGIYNVSGKAGPKYRIDVKEARYTDIAPITLP